jgi:hypothetical protein
VLLSDEPLEVEVLSLEPPDLPLVPLFLKSVAYHPDPLS